MSALVVVILNFPIVVIVEAAIGLLCVLMPWHLEMPVYRGGFNYLKSCILPFFFWLLVRRSIVSVNYICCEWLFYMLAIDVNYLSKLALCKILLLFTHLLYKIRKFCHLKKRKKNHDVVGIENTCYALVFNPIVALKQELLY